jgi:alkylresorcinol/alkylpyrone synthase
MNPISIRSIATAQPPHELDLAATSDLLGRMFSLSPRVLSMVAAQGVQHRRVIRDAEWYLAGHENAERNAVAVSAGEELGGRSAKEALARAGAVADEVVAVVVATSTMIAMPGLDAHLVEELGLRPGVLRVPMWGRGCAGGLAALRTATQLSAGMGGGAVLVVVVDCCTANVQAHDRTLANVVISSIYADGAVAMIVGATSDGGVATVEAATSTQVPGSRLASGWELTDRGLRHVYQPTIAASVAGLLPNAMAELCGPVLGTARPDLVVIHPAGKDALDRQADALHLDGAVRKVSVENFERRGNLSGPAVLFGLNDLLSSSLALDHASVALVGTGPGYTVELLLLQLGRVPSL